MPSQKIGRPRGVRAPSGPKSISETAGSGGLNGIAHAPFYSPQPEDDLSIPKFLRRTQ